MTVAELAQKAAAHWGGKLGTLIRDRENAVFSMEIPGKGRAALRLHRPGYQTAAAIDSELWFCDALALAGLPVPRILQGRDGTVLLRLEGGRLASAVEWLPGTPLGETGVPLSGSAEVQAVRHHALGRLLARMHDISTALPLPPEFTRPAWDVDGLTGETPFWGRFWEHPVLTPQEANLLQEARAFLRSALQDHATQTALIPIHADVLRENILVNGIALSLIDFDDSGMGFPGYDLGTVMSQNLYEPAQTDLRAALIEGYASLRPISARMVDIFTLARVLASVGWTIPRLARDNPINRSYIDRAVLATQKVIG